jgi:hypothetical protein
MNIFKILFQFFSNIFSSCFYYFSPNTNTLNDSMYFSVSSINDTPIQPYHPIYNVNSINNNSLLDNEDENSEEMQELNTNKPSILTELSASSLNIVQEYPMLLNGTNQFSILHNIELKKKLLFTHYQNQEIIYYLTKYKENNECISPPPSPNSSPSIQQLSIEELLNNIKSQEEIITSICSIEHSNSL